MVCAQRRLVGVQQQVIKHFCTCCLLTLLARVAYFVNQVATVMKEGRMFADTASGMVEVVSVNAAEIARLPYDLAEGLYVVGTGSTGAAPGLAVCGEFV